MKGTERLFKGLFLNLSVDEWIDSIRDVELMFAHQQGNFERKYGNKTFRGSLWLGKNKAVYTFELMDENGMILLKEEYGK